MLAHSEKAKYFFTNLHFLSLHLGSGVGTGGKELASRSHANEDPGLNPPDAGLSISLGPLKVPR